MVIWLYGYMAEPINYYIPMLSESMLSVIDFELPPRFARRDDMSHP
jgi:hypothetical protein